MDPSSSFEPPSAAEGGIVPPSSLWIDQDDAHRRIDAVLAAGEVSAERAAGLRHFVDRGYLVFSLDLAADVLA